MKKPKKHLKSLSRLNAYLKKEGSRLEKLIARIIKFRLEENMKKASAKKTKKSGK